MFCYNDKHCIGIYFQLYFDREKEKAELKDRKVLEILHSKDDRIAELEQVRR